MKNEKIKEEILFDIMSEEQMNTLFLELADTQLWQAILRYNRIKDAQAINSLASLDPFKDPTAVARTQGIRIGTYGIETEVNRLKEESNKKESK